MCCGAGMSVVAWLITIAAAVNAIVASVRLRKARLELGALKSRIEGTPFDQKHVDAVERANKTAVSVFTLPCGCKFSKNNGTHIYVSDTCLFVSQ